MRSQPACEFNWDALCGVVQHVCSHSLSEHATDICVSLSSWITFGRADTPPSHAKAASRASRGANGRTTVVMLSDGRGTKSRHAGSDGRSRALFVSCMAEHGPRRQGRGAGVIEAVRHRRNDRGARVAGALCLRTSPVELQTLLAKAEKSEVAPSCKRPVTGPLLFEQEYF